MINFSEKYEEKKFKHFLKQFLPEDLIENNQKMKCFPCYDLVCKTHKKNLLKNLSNNFVFKKIKNNLKQP